MPLKRQLSIVHRIQFARRIGQPLCSPDMVPSNYLLVNIEKDIEGRSFKDDSKLKSAVIKHLLGKLSFAALFIDICRPKTDDMIKNQYHTYNIYIIIFSDTNGRV